MNNFKEKIKNFVKTPRFRYLVVIVLLLSFGLYVFSLTHCGKVETASAEYGVELDSYEYGVLSAYSNADSKLIGNYFSQSNHLQGFNFFYADVNPQEGQRVYLYSKPFLYNKLDFFDFYLSWNNTGSRRQFDFNVVTQICFITPSGYYGEQYFVADYHLTTHTAEEGYNYDARDILTRLCGEYLCDEIYVTYFGVEVVFIGQLSEADIELSEIDFVFSYTTDYQQYYTFEDYLLRTDSYLKGLTTAQSVVPIATQIRDTVNAFMDIEIFPNFTFGTLLLMFGCIPLVWAVLKFFLGG